MNQRQVDGKIILLYLLYFYFSETCKCERDSFFNLFTFQRRASVNQRQVDGKIILLYLLYFYVSETCKCVGDSFFNLFMFQRRVSVNVTPSSTGLTTLLM